MHTPGPWNIGPMSGSIRPDVTTPHSGQINGGCVIATLYGSDMAYNADLIAAAPDLLEALQEFACQHRCGCGHPHCNDCARDRIADAAIAKATGLPPNTRNQPSQSANAACPAGLSS